MNRHKPGSYYYFSSKQLPSVDAWQLLRLKGRDISPHAQLKLEWIIAYHTMFAKHVTKLTKHYGISRKTFYKWFNRFDEKDLSTLEEESKAPEHVRQREITPVQRKHIRELRKAHLRWGKMKLRELYKKEYAEEISSWKIQKVIEQEKLYFDTLQQKKQAHKRKQAQKSPKKRITEFVKEDTIHHLWHVDTVVFTLPEGGYRYLLTAIDEVSKVAYARLYGSHISAKAAEFLRRLHYLTEGEMINLHHDNGSEFKKDFEKACEALSLPQWYSRPRTPKDNPVLERFNRTIQEEFVEMIDIGLENIPAFNRRLTEWLVEYNAVRPHQALDYLTPLEYLDQYYKDHLLPMSSSSTRPCNLLQICYSCRMVINREIAMHQLGAYINSNAAEQWQETNPDLAAEFTAVAEAHLAAIKRLEAQQATPKEGSSKRRKGKHSNQRKRISTSQ